MINKYKPAAIMTLEELKQTPIPFGPYKGKTIGEVGDFKHLDWLLGVVKSAEFKAKLKAFLYHPRIKHMVDDALR